MPALKAEGKSGVGAPSGVLRRAPGLGAAPPAGHRRAARGRAASGNCAIITADLQRFIEFYTSVFQLEVVFEESTPVFQHAIVRAGPSSWLHPVCLNGNVHGQALPDMFKRGHLDHVALLAASPAAFAQVRERLVARGASAGTVEELGPTHTLWFSDPDGMRGEVCLIVDPELRGFHAPRPLGSEASPSA